MTRLDVDYVEAITEHCAGFAEAAGRDLDATVEHCPGWTVADLVSHLTDVHWFWATIVGERLSTPPDESRRPAPVPRDQRIAAFSAGADRLTTVLAAAGSDDPVWTWAPASQTAGFVIRHQVQEAAVHHWDAANATGATMQIAPAIAADSIEEFLTHSVPSVADPADPIGPPLGAVFTLKCTDFAAAWTISDATPGALQFTAETDHEAPVITSTAADLLLWLYERISIDTSAVDSEVLERFRVF